jgi:hypothetical protein
MSYFGGWGNSCGFGPTSGRGRVHAFPGGGGPTPRWAPNGLPEQTPEEEAATRVAALREYRRLMRFIGGASYNGGTDA